MQGFLIHFTYNGQSYTARVIKVKHSPPQYQVSEFDPSLPDFPAQLTFTKTPVGSYHTYPVTSLYPLVNRIRAALIERSERDELLEP